jgi:hypothetical protein
MKTIPLALYPTYAEYINYSYGFMFADFPWANNYFSSILGNSSDNIFSPFLIYYDSMNFASMYLVALAIFIVLLGIGYLLLRSNKSKLLILIDKRWGGYR